MPSATVCKLGYSAIEKASPSPATVLANLLDHSGDQVSTLWVHNLDDVAQFEVLSTVVVTTNP